MRPTRSSTVAETTRESGRVGFVSLGCPKALVDSERILSHLRADGYELVPTYQDAELVVVNTCGFITPAVEESLAAIGEALEETGKVVVTGCLGERPETVMERHPRVLAVTGQADVDGVMRAVRSALPLRRDPFTSLLPMASARGTKSDALGPPLDRITLTPRHYAYLKVAEGCDHRCSFCIIPKLRGNLASRPAAAVVYEARRLVAAGAKELMLIAQDLSAYGNDLRHATSTLDGREVRAHLVDLVTELSGLGVWLRLHYVYPYPHVTRLVELMAADRVLPYLDVPLQHASTRVLRAMRRPGGAVSHLETIRAWRTIRPDITLRSTFIVGFPGETEEDFEQLLEFLGEARLDRVGAFTYSDVPEADANDLPGAVPEEVKAERYARLMELQARISGEKLAAKVGRDVDAIVDDYGALPGELVCRTVADAPDIDGLLLAEGDGTVKIGDVVRVRVTGASEHDLRGHVVGRVDLRPGVPVLAG
ncbi:MAG TPA: 30S ribosomal protein S12 methylthiotransferase RimO [Trueperaceae bacterium]